MIWSFSSYQLFVVYYAAIVMGCFLLLFERVMRTGEELRFWKLSGTLMVSFAIALIVYLLISRVYFSSSDYTDSLVDHSSAFTVFRNLAAHIVKALIAYRDVYSIGYTLSLIAMAASALHFRKMPFFRLLLLVVTAFELTPFYMTVVLGSVPAFRVQLVLPFVIAFNFYFAYRILVRMCGRRTYAMSLLGMAVFASVWLQTMNMQRLFYTDDIREQEDIRLMTQVSLQIGLVTGKLSPDKPVAFVGTHAAMLNPACRIGDSYGAGNMMGGWMNAAEAQFYDRQIRTTITINNSGLDYKLPTKAEYDLALKTAVEMPEFPTEGSIKELDNIIVVKLEKNLKGKARRN